MEVIVGLFQFRQECAILRKTINSKFILLAIKFVTNYEIIVIKNICIIYVIDTHISIKYRYRYKI